MADTLLSRLITMVLAAAVGSPLSGAVWAPACGDCASREAMDDAGGAVAGAHEGVAPDACCGSHEGDGGDENEDRDGGCRDCGCPDCVVHSVAGIVWTLEGAVPSVGASGFGMAWPDAAPARGDLSGLMRPPRTIAA